MGIDTTYDKVTSDARHRKIDDIYTKTEVNDRLAFKIDVLTLNNHCEFIKILPLKISFLIFKTIIL